MAEKIRILIVAANPEDTISHLRLEEEVREITRSIQTGPRRESFQVLLAEKPSDLRHILLRYSPHILHFTRQGTKNKGIKLGSRNGEIMTVNKQTLSRLFRLPKGHIRVLFFSGRLSRQQMDDIRKVIDFTIVTNELGDEAGALFASYFYQALAFGQSVRIAFDLAKIQLDFEGIDESKTPMMFVRQGVDTSKSYLIKPTGPEASGAVRSIKRPVKQGNISIADAARAVGMVLNSRD